MRILFAHDRFGAFAGAEANAWHTALELRRRGHSIAILHGPGTGLGESAWEEIFSPRFPLDAADPARSIAQALQTFAPEVVYVHNLSGSDTIEALLSSGTPLVRMVHDHQLYCLRGCKYPVFSRRICTRALSPYCVFPCGGSVARDRSRAFPLRWVSYTERKHELDLHRRFTRLVVASRHMQEELERNGIETARIEIHAPVPPPAEVISLGAFSERNLLVYAGQIVRGKGVDVLLEALARVTTPFECVILGDGHHRAYCERLSRVLGLTGKVHFAGYVPQSRIKEYYGEATAALMSSVWPEPFGATGLEAMRHGLPVVAFDAGAIKEWLHDGENGFLAPWMDRDRFAAGIDQLLRNKTLARRMGDAGRRLVSERHDFNGYIAGLENLFARAVEECNAPPRADETPLAITPRFST